MKNLTFPLLLFGIVLFFGCSKNISNSNNNGFICTTSSLWPLKAGNAFLYQDSVFDANNNVIESFSDSAYITNQTVNINGSVFYGINDSLGWFGTGSYVTVGSSNTSLYMLDSANASSAYIFFAEAPGDSYLIASSKDFSNPNCISTDALYGFATTYTIKGYTCYKSVETITDCNNAVTYALVYYVSPGAGIVRIEEYSQNPSNTSQLYLDYSQTLVSEKIN